MKSYDILGARWKIWLLGGESSWKTNKEGGGDYLKKGGLDSLQT